MKRKRADESNEEREARLEAMRVNNAAAREIESEEQKRARLEADRDQTAAARETESVEQKNARLNANRENMKNTREAETIAQKEKRNSADRHNKKKVRDDRDMLRATRIDVAPFSVGLMNQVCSCCSSLMFAGETHSGKLGVNGEPGTASFSMCCR